MKNHHVDNRSRTFSVFKHLDNFLESTSASAYLKDKNGSYLKVNEVFVRISDLHSVNDVLGRTDLDLWDQQAPIMMKNDQEVICKDKAKTVIESAQCLNGTMKHFLSHKAPLRNKKGNIMGVFGLSFLIDKEHPISSALNQIPIYHPHMVDQITPYNIPLNTASHNKLTKRQIDCLYYLVKGMTMKQIATTLSLSPKTVEHYLDAIKIKLNCHNRVDLIKKALQLPCIKFKLRA